MRGKSIQIIQSKSTLPYVSYKPTVLTVLTVLTPSLPTESPTHLISIFSHSTSLPCFIHSTFSILLGGMSKVLCRTRTFTHTKSTYLIALNLLFLPLTLIRLQMTLLINNQLILFIPHHTTPHHTTPFQGNMPQTEHCSVPTIISDVLNYTPQALAYPLVQLPTPKVR